MKSTSPVSESRTRPSAARQWSVSNSRGDRGAPHGRRIRRGGLRSHHRPRTGVRSILMRPGGLLPAGGPSDPGGGPCPPIAGRQSRCTSRNPRISSGQALGHHRAGRAQDGDDILHLVAKMLGDRAGEGRTSSPRPAIAIGVETGDEVGKFKSETSWSARISVRLRDMWAP